MIETVLKKDLKPGKNKISFESESEKVVGNIFVPKGFSSDKKYKVFIIQGAITNVKEQMAGIYARRLANEGFITFAFDYRCFGESEGEPRYFENPESKIKDLENAVNFIRGFDFVEKVILTGVCASGGYVLKAASRKVNIDYVCTIVGFLPDKKIAERLFMFRRKKLNRLLKMINNAEKKYLETGKVEYIPTASKEGHPASPCGRNKYYLGIGNVPNWRRDKFALMSWNKILSYDPNDCAEEIEVPVLMIHSALAATPINAKNFFKRLKVSNKKMVWLKGKHIDFYYKERQISKTVKEICQFFK